MNTVIQVSGWSVLTCVAKYGHLNILSLLMEFGAEVNAQDKVYIIHYTVGCVMMIIQCRLGALH